MMVKLNPTLPAFVVFCFFASDAGAQLYRCGSSYQDRPCTDAQSSKVVPGTAAARPSDHSSTATAQKPLPAECAQRGLDSQKIVWSREGGKTEEAMLAEESSPARRKLISDVYRVRGSVAQVKQRIEAECRAEVEERARLLALRDVLDKSQPVQPAAPAAKPDNLGSANSTAQKEAAAKSRCEQIFEQRESVRTAQRSGGSSATMESLNRRMEAFERELRQNNC
jgi:hypothetical protein